MAFDFKKEFKDLYRPGNQPSIIEVPPMNFIAVRGNGDPNVEDGAYKKSIELLYTVAYTIKMSKKGAHQIQGYFDFVVPPLEGLWWQPGIQGVDYEHLEDFNFISMLRLPDFIERADVDWALGEASRKKKKDFSRVEFLPYNEGLCVQCLHRGPYKEEPVTVARMHELMASKGYELDITMNRMHHEIYICDARKVVPEKLKTILRHPIKPGTK